MRTDHPHRLKRNITPHAHYRLYIVTSFQREQYGKMEKKSNFIVEIPDKPHFSWGIKVNTKSEKACQYYTDTMKTVLYP